MPHDIREVADALGARAEEVCRRLLPRGRLNGRYWTVGSLDGEPGRSMWVRLRPPGRPGQWMDAATGEHGDLLDIIRHQLGTVSIGAALEAARTIAALPAPASAVHPSAATSRNRHDESRRTEAALRVWRACRPLPNTHAEAYLHARGLTRSDSSALRFHPALRYRWDETRTEYLPGLVAAITTNEGEITGIHRTFLDPACPAKARVPAPRKALGRVHGHGARFTGFAENGSILIAGEGVETVLSVLTALPDLPGAAALSAPGLGCFVPPPGVHKLVIARDNDVAGERAARRLEQRCRELGVDTRVLVPMLGDFNEDLRALGPAALAERIAPILEPSAGTGTATPQGPARESGKDSAKHRPNSGHASRGRPPTEELPHTERSHPMDNTANPTNPTATFMKLRSGAWGVRVPARAHRLAPGETARLEVHPRSGDAQVKSLRCFWLDVDPTTGEEVALCEILPSDATRREDGRESP